MNMNREPRFYAWVAFENGYYECRTDDKRYAYHKFWGAERSEGDKWLTGFWQQKTAVSEPMTER